MSKVKQVRFKPRNLSLASLTLKYLSEVSSHSFEMKWNEKAHNDKRFGENWDITACFRE